MQAYDAGTALAYGTFSERVCPPASVVDPDDVMIIREVICLVIWNIYFPQRRIQPLYLNLYNITFKINKSRLYLQDVVPLKPKLLGQPKNYYNLT